MPNIGSPSNIRFSEATSLPAIRVAAATQASPRGRTGMFIVSVFAEISRTLTNSPRPPVVPSVVPDFHFGIPPGYECTLQSLVLKNGSRMHCRLCCSTSGHLLRAPRRFFRSRCRPVRADIMWPTATAVGENTSNEISGAPQGATSAPRKHGEQICAGLMSPLAGLAQIRWGPSPRLTPWATFCRPLRGLIRAREEVRAMFGCGRQPRCATISWESPTA